MGLAILAVGGTFAAHAQSLASLQLDVSVNGSPKHLIGTFSRDDQGRLGAIAQELDQIGIKVPEGSRNRYVPLNSIPGLTFDYDEPRQAISILVPEAGLAPKMFNLGAASEQPPIGSPVRRDFGALLNYNLFAASSQDIPASKFSFNGASATLEGRFFGNFGTLSQTGIATSAGFNRSDLSALRLDTAWTYSDPDNSIRYRAGDTITGGLAWTRPIRLGGIQVQRNFGLRPDLVTLPLPSVSGTAAVPSSIDVYVNSIKTFTQEVGGGPFQINNLPAVSGAGNARVVVRDASGREMETNLPFFVSSKLLRPGLYDFSLEGGFARLNYGSQSFSYSPAYAGSASGRYGLADWITLEGHAETAPGFINGGLGANVRSGSLGLATVAVSGSQQHTGRGGQVYAGYEMQLWGITLSAATQRTLGGYNDLAGVTAPKTSFSSALQVVGLSSVFDFGSVRPPKAIDRVSVSLPLLFDPSAVSLSLANVVDAERKRSKIASASYSRNLPFGASMFVTAFVDLERKKDAGVFLGLSVPLGTDIATSTSVSRDRNGLVVNAQAVKAIHPEPGSYGWRVSDTEGNQAVRSASFSQRSSIAQVEAGVAQAGRGIQGSAQIDGAVAVAGGDVFLSPRINDAFAVVNANAANVDVQVENRPAGTTRTSGKLLIPDLRSFQKNQISIDPANLPINATIESTREVVTPADGGVAVIDFGVQASASTAVVLLIKPDRKVLPVGWAGRLNGDTPFVVGYDGRAFITGLKATNALVISGGGEPCTATFNYVPKANGQTTIGPTVCQ